MMLLPWRTSAPRRGARRGVLCDPPRPAGTDPEVWGASVCVGSVCVCEECLCAWGASVCLRMCVCSFVYVCVRARVCVCSRGSSSSSISISSSIITTWMEGWAAKGPPGASPLETYLLRQEKYMCVCAYVRVCLCVCDPSMPARADRRSSISNCSYVCSSRV